ncbi:AraC family transcriptional regulator [Mesorhizobium sp. USDA-HM6]|nr:AraC family transcriptional regulator [Mesorhizobium sp. USDA-HM6]
MLNLLETFDFDPNKFRRSQHRTLAHHYESWGNVRADLIRRTCLERQETRLTQPRHTFLMNLKGAARRGEDFVDGRRISFSPRGPGSIIYIPADSDWTGWDEGDATASYLLVSIEREFADRTFEGMGRSRTAGVSPSIGFRDNMIETALQTIAIELKQSDATSVTMVESQATLLFVQMVRLTGTSYEPSKGGLSPYDLRRAIGMIDALPHKWPSLADLAKEVGVSPFHFSRAFKQSTGMTPHAFMAKRRLERSADMLRSTNLSATEIALECGFAGSSHFSTAFKRGFGANPMEFRRRWKI